MGHNLITNKTLKKEKAKEKSQELISQFRPWQAESTYTAVLCVFTAQSSAVIVHIVIYLFLP